MREGYECWSGIVWRIGQTMRKAFLPACQVLCMALGRSLGVQLLKLKAWMMQEIRSGKKKNTAKSERYLALLRCTLLWFGYRVYFIVPARLTLGLKSQSLLYGSFWWLYLPLIMTSLSAHLSLHGALLTHGPVSVFKESENQLLVLPALRHCQAAASWALHLRRSNSGRISGSSGVWTISDPAN